MKRTQKEIKQQIAEMEKRLADIENYRKNIPGYAELEIKLGQMKNKYFEDVYSEQEALRSDIRALNMQVAEMKKEKQLDIPARIQNWFSSYKSVVYWGYGGLKIVWISPDERFVIITNKSGIAGTGTAMGRGNYYYAKSEHWIADTTKSGGKHGYGSHGNRYMKTEGRLTKELKQKMIAYMEELRK